MLLTQNGRLTQRTLITKGYQVVNLFLLQFCFTVAYDKNKWYLDSGCSRHVTEDKSKLYNLKESIFGEVTFWDSSKGKVIGIGSVGNEHVTILDVQLVTGLYYNLLSISQLCDNGFRVIFSPTHFPYIIILLN